MLSSLPWLSLCLLFFFLWGIFSLTTSIYALHHLYRSKSKELLEGTNPFFFYKHLHKIFFPSKDFRLLLYSAELSRSLCRMCFGFSLALVLFLYFPSLHLLGFLLVLLGALFLFLFLGDFIPFYLGTLHPRGSFRLTSFFTSSYLTLFFPFVILFVRWKKETEESVKSPFAREKLIDLIQELAPQLLPSSHDRKLLTSIFSFKERIVREVMVPRIHIFALPGRMKIKEALIQLIEEGYSRVPIFDDNIDQIQGVLLYKDLLKVYLKGGEAALEKPLETLTKEVFFTPETKKVSELLQEFRLKQMHMAIVVDEYGGTEGIVTIEDLLEEIVGDIADEYDLGEELPYKQNPDGSWVVDAQMSIFDIQEHCHIDIPLSTDYDTIGGYIFHKAGSIPDKGTKLHHDDFDLEILAATERSIDKVLIRPRS